MTDTGLPLTSMAEKHDLPSSDDISDGEGVIPHHLISRQLQLELDLLKNDYKKVLSALYQKKEVIEIQAHSIEELKTSFNTLLQTLSNLTGKDNELNQSVDRLTQDLQDKENMVSGQSRKIHELYQQIEQLNVQLSEIYASEGWKLLSVYYKIRDAILPAGSPRQRRVKNFISHFEF